MGEQLVAIKLVRKYCHNCCTLKLHECSNAYKDGKVVAVLFVCFFCGRVTRIRIPAQTG